MDFDSLSKLRRLIEAYTSRHVSSLVTYRAPKLGFLHTKDPKSKGDWHKVSTATCVNSLLDARLWPDFQRKIEATTDYSKNLVSQMLTETNWSSAALGPKNPLTVSALLEAAVRLHEAHHVEFDDNHRKGLTRAATLLMGVLDSGYWDAEAPNTIPDSAQRGSISLQGYPPNAFMTHFAWRALLTLRRRFPELDFSGKDKWDPLSKATAKWCQNEIRRQLAMEAHPELHADFFQLAYAVVTWASLTQIPDRQPEDFELARLGLQTFYEAQEGQGGWPRSNPLFHYPAFGNAYCYEFELLVQILARDDFVDVHLSHLDQLAKVLGRLDRQAYTDAEGNRFWASGHYPQLPGPESWSTAAVYQFLFKFNRLIAEGIRREVFAYLKEPYGPPPIFDDAKWARFLDCPISLEPEAGSLKACMDQTLVKPLQKAIAGVRDGFPISEEAFLNGKADASPVNITAIFHGPPGTSKTELARLLSQRLAWRQLSVETSHFVRKGQDQIQAEVDKIFDMLVELEEAVVFLDEFDEMVRERDASKEPFSRLLTTLLLPKLSRLSDRRRVVFVLATNHLERFDAAIRRPGRFDMILPVLPPSYASKIGALPQELTALFERNKAQEMGCGQSLHQGGSNRAKCTLEDAIGDLTFLEFKQLRRKLRSNMEDSKMVELVKEAHRSCVMMSPAILDGETKEDSKPAEVHEKTWRHRMVELAVRTRTPGYVPPS